MTQENIPSWKHQRISLENSILYKNAYADSCSFGNCQPPILLVVYFGGAISPETYDLRRETEPLAILSEFQSAVTHLHRDATQLLVIPNPPVMRTAPNYRRRVTTFVTDELITQVRPEPLQNLALVGFSYGAYVAATLAFGSPQVRALATLGGIGMAQALSESQQKLYSEKRYLCFANSEDMIGTESREFSRHVAAREIRIDLIERQGGHTFDDYATNCSVRHAFAFLLESVS